jgi:hypothetical protein
MARHGSFLGLILTAVLAAGCQTISVSMQYPQGVDRAAGQIGVSAGVASWEIEDTPPPSTNAVVVIPATTNTWTSASRRESEAVLALYPYALQGRKKIRNGYEWTVKQDVSGIIRHAGRLRIFEKGTTLLIEAPNKIVEQFVVKTLEGGPKETGLAPREEPTLSALSVAIDEQREKVAGIQGELDDLRRRNAPARDIQKTREELANSRRILKALEEKRAQERERKIKKRP